MSTNICVETPEEYEVQEITYDGEEIHSQPLSMSENLTQLAEKIDFGKTSSDVQTTSETGNEEIKELATVQASLWPWDSVRCKLRSMLTEVCVLIDVLNIAKEKRFMSIDPVSQDVPEPAPKSIVLLQKKKALANAAAVLKRGADRLHEGIRSTSNDFNLELLDLGKSWKMKKVGNTILGDLSYRSAGSRYWQSGVFEITKNEVSENLSSPNVPLIKSSAIKVLLPKQLAGNASINVWIQNDTKTIASGRLSLFEPPDNLPSTEIDKKLMAAQNVLFCKELFSRLAREAVEMESSIPNVVVGNLIGISIFPDVKLNIELCHTTVQDRIRTTDTENNELKRVLQHSLYQLLRLLHYNAIHHPMPHPTTSTLGVSKCRRLAGPRGSDRETILRSVKNESILDQIIKQTQHMVLRLRTMYVVDTVACEIKHPSIVTHWSGMSSPTLSHVIIHMITGEINLGFGRECRTSLVIHVAEKSLKVICRDGRTLSLSYEAQELRDLLIYLASQHQVTGVQNLAFKMGWTISSVGPNLSAGSVEPTGNASSLLITSAAGDRIIALRSSPKNGVQVSISVTPQTTDFYPGTLVRDRKWQNLPGSFREVDLEKMKGRNLMLKLENLIACLTKCQI